ncbi:hypothetical protein MMC18_001724 [Xylographa bjoerkii]|nr:hypothetical protein [Xylographa bjoerkii]
MHAISLLAPFLPLLASARVSLQNQGIEQQLALTAFPQTCSFYASSGPSPGYAIDSLIHFTGIPAGSAGCTLDVSFTYEYNISSTGSTLLNVYNLLDDDITKYSNYAGYYPQGGSGEPISANGLWGSLTLNGAAHTVNSAACTGNMSFLVEIASQTQAGTAQQNFQAQGVEKAVTARMMDYHHLDGLDDESVDGIYTMDTLVHATDPEKALEEFYRVMKPDGSTALYEYDHPNLDAASKDHQNYLLQALKQINRGTAIPANDRLDEGVLQRMLENQGFEDVVVWNLSENMEPMMRLFFLVAYIPYFFICLLGLRAWLVNTETAVQGYRLLRKGLTRSVAVTARKPSNETPRRSKSGLREKRAG